MDTLIKADIFFFVTAVAVVAVAFLLAVVLVYVVLILRQVMTISRRVNEESQKVVEDIETLRQQARESGRKLRDSSIRLSERLCDEGEQVIDDVSSARQFIKAEVGLIRHLFTYLLGFFTINKRRSSKKTKSTSNRRSPVKKK